MDKADLERQVRALEKQLQLKEQSFMEERKELEAENAELVASKEDLVAEKEGLDSKVRELKQEVTERASLEERMQNLEQHFKGSAVENLKSDVALPSVGVGECFGKEKSIELTFGEDTSPHLLEKFLSHYRLVDRINRERGVRVWKRSEYRALMLRSALRGAASEFVENEELIMLSPWVKDDQQMIVELKKRYITNTAIEIRIIEFETANQDAGEPLGEYLVRLQRLMEKAYSSHPQFVKQVRVVWQFLNGIHDREVREALIREKWMQDGKCAKSYDEILKIAESVVNVKVAARATGKGGAVGAISQVTGSFKSPPKGSRDRVMRLSNAVPYNKGNWECWYCKTTDHGGGWSKCPMRKKQDPRWEPSREKQGFQKVPNHNQLR